MSFVQALCDRSGCYLYAVMLNIIDNCYDCCQEDYQHCCLLIGHHLQDKMSASLQERVSLNKPEGSEPESSQFCS